MRPITPRRIAIALALFISVLAVPGALAQSAFTVRVAGARENLMMVRDNDRIVLRSNTVDQLAIPVNSVQAIVRASTGPGPEGYTFPNFCCAYDADFGGNAGIELLLLAFTTGSKKGRVIGISWKDGDHNQALFLETPRGDDANVLKWLKQQTDKSFRDLDLDRDRVAREIDQGANESFTVSLDHDISMGSLRLNAGMYNAIAVGRGQGGADLYLFDGPMEPKSLAGVLATKVEMMVNGVGAAEVEYGTGANKDAVMAVRLPDRTYRVMW